MFLSLIGALFSTTPIFINLSKTSERIGLDAICDLFKIFVNFVLPAGKTRLINFFKIDDTWMLVDVPGYGYAKMSKQMLIKMGKMMDTYFNQREQICCVVQLVDARHGATHDDLDMIEMIQSLGIQIVIVATKVDKIPKTKRVRALKDISQQLQLPMKNIFGISSTEKTGFEPVLERINEIVEQAKK